MRATFYFCFSSYATICAVHPVGALAGERILVPRAAPAARPELGPGAPPQRAHLPGQSASRQVRRRTLPAQCGAQEPHESPRRRLLTAETDLRRLSFMTYTATYTYHAFLRGVFVLEP